MEAIRLAGEFHLYLASLTGDPLLQRHLVEIISRCSLVMTMYGRPHSTDCGAREHREIVDALMAGDFTRAGELMERHVEDLAAGAQLSVRPKADVRLVRNRTGVLGDAPCATSAASAVNSITSMGTEIASMRRNP